MSEKQYQQLLATARRDLKLAYREREHLDRTIAKLRQTVVSLGALCDEEGSGLEDFKVWFSPIGKNLTEAVTNAVVGSKKPVSPVEIRNILEDLGYRFQSSNPLASIHSVVKRLVEQEVFIKTARANPDGSVDDRGHLWWGYASPPEPWVLETDTELDTDRKQFVLKKKAGRK